MTISFKYNPTRIIIKSILSVLCIGIGLLFLFMCMGSSTAGFLATLALVLLFLTISFFSFSLLVLIWGGKKEWIKFIQEAGNTRTI